MILTNMENIMIYKIQIEKTDVKLYDLEIPIDMDEIKDFVDENYESFDKFLEDNEDNEEFNITKKDYYFSFVYEFLKNKDPELLFMDWCFDHTKYNLEKEDCSLISIRK